MTPCAPVCHKHPDKLCRTAQETATRSLLDLTVCSASQETRMEKLLSEVGSLLCGMGALEP